MSSRPADESADQSPKPCCERSLNGLIQHSFALRMVEDRRPFDGDRTRETVAERFSLPSSGGDAEFRVEPVGKPVDQNSIHDVAPHSLLVANELTTVQPQRIAFLERDSNNCKYIKSLPNAFSWAAKDGVEPDNEKSKARFIFAETEEDGRVDYNDFLVKEARDSSNECEAESVSEVLLQLIAHRRSLLFGLTLANRFVNVMLPHALLEPMSGDPKKCRRAPVCKSKSERKDMWSPGSWILQPMVSLIHVVEDGGGPFRRMYTLTLFLIPVENSGCGEREMSECELCEMVNAEWNLASSPWPEALPESDVRPPESDVQLSRFDVRGPLVGYTSRLAQPDVSCLMQALNGSQLRHENDGAVEWRSPTLRQATEAIAFAVALRIAQGPAGRANVQAKRRIGDDIVTSLGSARMSSVLVVDGELTKDDLRNPKSDAGPPGKLGTLMGTLAGETRVPCSSPWTTSQQRKYRLDRPFYDWDSYAVGVLPTNPCLVTTSARCAQMGRFDSGLIQAGNAAYMTIGAATAIGTLRAIDRDLERMESAEPTKIAEIEGEIAVDLHEIYDLDITHEGYRHLYRLLRDRLGIARDYETLQGKMQALDSETTTRHEIKAQTQLAWLTVAIVALTVLLLIVTLAK
jgi:hypothetical protein